MRLRPLDLLTLLAVFLVASLVLVVVRGSSGSRVAVDLGDGLFVRGVEPTGTPGVSLEPGDRLATLVGREVTSFAELGDVLRGLDPAATGTATVPATFERYRYRFTETLGYRSVVERGLPDTVRPTDRVVGYDRRDVRGDIDQQTILAILANRPDKRVPFAFERPVHRFNVELPVRTNEVPVGPVLLFAFALMILVLLIWRGHRRGASPHHHGLLLSFGAATAMFPWALVVASDPTMVLKDPALLAGALVGLALVRPFLFDAHRRLLGAEGRWATMAIVLPGTVAAALGIGLAVRTVTAMALGPLPAGHDQEVIDFVRGVSVLVAATHALDLVLWFRVRSGLKAEDRIRLRLPTMGLLLSSLALVSALLSWAHDGASFSESFGLHVAALILIGWVPTAGFVVGGFFSAVGTRVPELAANPLTAVADYLTGAAALVGGGECRLVWVRGRLALVVSVKPVEAVGQVVGAPLDVSRAPEPLRASVGLFHDEQVELPLGRPVADRVGEELAVGAGESVGLAMAVLLHDEGTPGPASLGGGPTYVYLVSASVGAEHQPERVDVLRKRFESVWPSARAVAGEALVAEAASAEAADAARHAMVSEPYPAAPQRVEVVREVQVPSRELPFLRRDLGTMYPVDEPSQVPAIARARCGPGAETDTPLILVGTPGVGKELVARWYHSQSELAAGAFIRFSVSSCPASLRQIELLGDGEEGGCLGAALGGVLFVEGAAELADSVVDRLLHDASVSAEPVAIVLSVRCPALVRPEDHLAQLRGSVGELGRGILSHRVVVLPRLSETPDRVTELSEFFMHRFAMKHNRVITSLTDEARAVLVGREWVAGVTELKAVVEAAVLRCNTGVISADDLGVHAP